LFLYCAGSNTVADAVEVTDRLRGRWPDVWGAWLFPESATFGASNRFSFRDEIVINEILYHAPPRLEVAGPVSPGALETNQLLSLTNLWRYEATGAELGSAWRMPDFDDRAWPAGRALFYVTTSPLQAPKNTPLTLGPVTYYFRTEFVYAGEPAPQLFLQHIVDDGAVFYLNGVELARYRMAPGVVTNGTRASSGVGIPALSASTNLSAAGLRLGTNILAVEVHQAISTGNDMAFGAQLSVATESRPPVPYQESEEQWVELFNRSSQDVSLAGWRLDEGIDFRFASNTVLPAGGYLVVARDPVALRAKYPDLAVVGPFTNQLSRRGERLVLKDAANNPADTVRYFEGGRWPWTADGGGSSLELREPRADNALAEAWAASDEGRKSAWRTYAYRGVAGPSAVGPDGQWREFVMGLLDAGEIWLDDIRVTESPDASPVALLQNGTFETGTNAWRILGNHRGEVIDDPDQPGNHVLRLIATGPTEHMSNHGETTLASNRDVVNGRTYEIAFRAKWIRGSRQFNTRLYFNRLARTTLLEAADSWGTPGARNSTWVTNLGPTYLDVHHQPTVPAPFSPVTVSVSASDPDGVAGLTLHYSVNSGAWSNTAMTLGAFGRYSAVLPGWAAHSLVQFYVEGADARGARSTFPAAGRDARALFKVEDGLAATNGLHNLRILLRSQDADRLHNPLNALSNERLGCTVIYDEREVFYDAGVRLRGSEVGRISPVGLGFFLAFPADHLFRGTHHTMGIERSGGDGSGQREMLVEQTFNHAGGVPTKYHDLAQILPPRLQHTGPGELQLARYTDVFLDAQFANGGQGMLYEYEIIYRLTTTDTGTPEGNKVPQSDGWVGTTLQDLGPNKENYRWTFLVDNNRARDDFSRVLPWARAMGQTGPAFLNAITNYIDVDQWLRTFAVSVLSGTSDNYGAVGDVHNGQFYVRPSDTRVLFFPHDLDVLFEATRPIVHGDLAKLVAAPAYARSYYRHLRDIIATTCNRNYMGHWTRQFGRLLPAQNFAAYLQFFEDRAAFVQSQISAAVPPVAFAITSNGGRDFLATSNSVTLEGNAWLDVKEILLEGWPQALPITWLTPSRWQVQVPLILGPNPLTFRAVGDRTNTLASARLTVVSTVPGGGADTDADGLPDLWEKQFGLNFLAPDATADRDADGLNNLDEYLAGTDPTNRQSTLRLAGSLGASGELSLSWMALAGRSYSLLQSTTPAGGLWTPLNPVAPALTNRLVTSRVPLSPAPARQFYRLVTPRVSP
jgi:hypothetical protein